MRDFEEMREPFYLGTTFWAVVFCNDNGFPVCMSLLNACSIEDAQRKADTIEGAGLWTTRNIHQALICDDQEGDG